MKLHIQFQEEWIFLSTIYCEVCNKNMMYKDNTFLKQKNQYFSYFPYFWVKFCDLGFLASSRWKIDEIAIFFFAMFLR